MNAKYIIVLAFAVGCGGERALKDLCEDNAACTSDPDCPDEPSNAGVRCDLPDNAECFYCAEGDRIDASHYECVDGRWQRHDNLDCN